VFPSSQVCNLGVIFDSHLALDAHIKRISKSAFFHLRNIARIRPFLSLADAESLVHALVTSRVYYSNALYLGLYLQNIQNSAARVLTHTPSRQHISGVLRALHWLPVQFRIHFKILLFVFKSLHNQAPGYLSDLLHQYIPSRSLRSGDQNLILIPHSRLKRRGDRAFSVTGPRLWNDLPVEIRMAPSLTIFKSLLKTHLFSLAY
ncbi:hypothetical protein PO909_022010, partial [Leuciscus waleckii]